MTELKYVGEIDYSQIIIEKELGAGGFGSVHLVKYRGMTCAMKQLKLTHCDNSKKKKLVSSLKLEAEALSKLGQCPYIIQFIGTCIGSGNTMCMLMEYINGRDLAKFIEKDCDIFNWDLRQRVTIEIALGMNFIHSKGIIHRDIKSDNILIDCSGEMYRAKIADFGICRVEKEDFEAEKTMTFMGAGSPCWMAPELFNKIGVEPTKKTDIYALGVVMWEICALKRPFQNMDHHQIGINKLNGTIEEVPSSTPQNYKELMMRCQHPDPIIRPFADEVAYLIKSWTTAYDTHIQDVDALDLGTIFGTKFYETSLASTVMVSKYDPIDEEKFESLLNEYETYKRESSRQQVVSMLKMRIESDSLGKFYMVVGTIYYEGARLSRNYNKSLFYYKKSAELKNLEGITRLGIMYKHGYGIEQPDLDGAFELFTMAAKNGSAAAQYSLGECYSLGLGTSQDIPKAVYYFRQSAAQEFPQALYMLGHYYYNGEVVETNYSEAFRLYKKAGDKGHGDAQFSLGIMYKHGIGLDTNDEEALRWFRKAAIQGHSRAQNNTGSCYYFGIGTAKDLLEAAGWYRKSAMQGNPSAQYNLAECYSNGHGVEQNPKEAFIWLNKSAEQGHSGAQLQLGMCYFTGVAIDKDYDKAIKYFKLAADQNNPVAQSSLAQCYLRGQGTNIDNELGFNYSKLASEAGQVEGMHQLACCYFNGVGTMKDFDKAFYWFKEAHDKGHKLSGMALATCYKDGLGTAPSDELSFKCYLELSESGDSDAQSNVGSCYLLGKGVAMDLEKAIYYFNLAVERNNPSGLVNLAQCYQNGNGVEKDEAKAVELYTKAADQGSLISMFNLAVSYERGDGLFYKDMQGAMRYYEMAANKGFLPAQERLTQLKLIMQKVRGKNSNLSKSQMESTLGSTLMNSQLPNSVNKEETKKSCTIM